MELYKLADSCDYGAMKDEMIRDRLIVCIRDGPLSERLQLDPDLTLEKAKKMVRQREAVHDQQQVLKGASSDTHVLEELRPKRGSTQTQAQAQAAATVSPAAENVHTMW